MRAGGVQLGGRGHAGGLQLLLAHEVALRYFLRRGGGQRALAGGAGCTVGAADVGLRCAAGARVQQGAAGRVDLGHRLARLHRVTGPQRDAPHHTGQRRGDHKALLQPGFTLFDKADFQRAAADFGHADQLHRLALGQPGQRGQGDSGQAPEQNFAAQGGWGQGEFHRLHSRVLSTAIRSSRPMRQRTASADSNADITVTSAENA